MRCGLGLFAFFFGFHASSVLAANCAFQSFSTVPGVDIDLRWAVNSGHPCTLMLKIGSGTGATRMLVVQQAAHGVAATPTLSRISDVSRPGFVGQDRFVHREDHGVHDPSRYQRDRALTIAVNVMP